MQAVKKTKDRELADPLTKPMLSEPTSRDPLTRSCQTHQTDGRNEVSLAQPRCRQPVQQRSDTAVITDCTGMLSSSVLVFL